MRLLCVMTRDTEEAGLELTLEDEGGWYPVLGT